MRGSYFRKAREGKIPWALCSNVADDFGVTKREMGEILNEMKIRISQCQLGCFG